MKLEGPNGAEDWQTLVEYAYNGRTWRIVKHNWNAGILTEARHFFFTDSWQGIEERFGEMPSTASAEQQFVWSQSYIDDLVLRDRKLIQTAALDERLYLLQDSLSNSTAICTPSGQIPERFTCFPYGLSASLAANYEPCGELLNWEITFCGYHFDTLTKLLLSRHRFLFVQLGRWLNPDPLGVLDNINYYT